MGGILAIIQAIIDIIQIVIPAIVKIISSLHGQPSEVKKEAVCKSVEACREHVAGLTGNPTQPVSDR